MEIIRYIVLQYEDLDTNFIKLSSDHENLHAMYEVNQLEVCRIKTSHVGNMIYMLQITCRIEVTVPNAT